MQLINPINTIRNQSTYVCYGCNYTQRLVLLFTHASNRENNVYEVLIFMGDFV